MDSLLNAKLTETETKIKSRLDQFNSILQDSSIAKSAIRLDIANEVQRSCDLRID
jgi:hypothetical protein